MGAKTPKQFLTLGGLPLLVHSLRVLEASDDVQAIVLAVSKAELDYCRQEIVSAYRFKKVQAVVEGGEERQDSVGLGMAAVGAEADIVLVHDAVRPFLTTDMVARVIAAAAKHGAAIVAIPVRDTVKRVGANGQIDKTVDRKSLWSAQTPQAARRALLQEAHTQAKRDGFRGTDEAQLIERLGQRVAIVEGSTENIKVTRPEDLMIAEAILAGRQKG